jgi:ribosomal protein S19
MGRSSKKGPYVDPRLYEKADAQLVGHKLGEFSPTRQFRGHGGKGGR